jgi:hypothetical protein
VLKAVLAIPLLALPACGPARPPDPLLSERAPAPEVAACLEKPESRAYVDAVKQRLFDAWELPRGLRADQELSILMRIDSEGELYLALVPDAGSSELEESALAAIEDAKPYPPLPEAAACLRGRPFRATFRNPAR